jgi:hypothetical protein
MNRVRCPTRAALVVLLACLLSGCGGGGQSQSPNQPPAITSGNSTTFVVGTAGSFTVTATGFPAPTLSQTGALPSGVTFNASTGVLSGTPGDGTGGAYPIAFTASNGVGSDVTENFTLTVNQAPAITSGNSTTFTVGTAGSFTVTATGFPTPTPSETGTLPSGVSFTDNGNGTATLGGTPAAGSGGTYSLSLTAHNGIGSDATQPFTLTVNQAPAITSGNSTTFTAGTAGSFTVTATGFPTATWAKIGTLPSGVSFTDNGNGTATLGGTPAAGSGGTYSLSLAAHNGIGSDATQPFTLTVNQAPAITSGSSTTFTVGTVGSFTVTATGFPASTLSHTGALPSGVTFKASSGVLSGTPAAGTGGAYSITITASNGVTPNATQNFTLTVNQPPAITSGNSTTFTVGTAGSFTVTATGFPTPTLSQTGALPSGVTFNASSGVLSGMPAAGTGGTYSITITASNGVTPNATQNFTLTVNQPPAITSGNSTTFTVGTAGSFTVTATGFPTPTLGESGALPSGVTFNASSGVLSGTPAAGTGGTYSIAITASNGVTPNATQNFTLAVNQAPAITSGSSTTFTVGTAGSFTVTATGFPTATLAKTGTMPSGVSFTDNGNGTATLGGTPAAGSGGTYSLSLTAHNGIGSDATQPFTLTVNQAPAITSGNSATFTVGTVGSFTVTATGFPTPTLGESGALPSGVTFNASSGVLSGTPAAGTGGTYSIAITASNGVTPNATQNFTLAVNQAPAITSGSSTTFTVGTVGSFTVTATGFPTPTLSQTGALPSGVTFNMSTGVLSGTPAAGTGGTYSLSLTAHNGIGSDATQPFTLTVNQAPAITSGSSTTFTVGTVGSFTVTATGFPTPTLGETGTMPSGVNFTDNGNGTATLGGTPAAGSGGTYSLSLTAHNGIGSDATQPFTLTVNQAPAITSANSTTFTVGEAGSFTVTATGFPEPTLSESGALPSGVTFNPATGVLAGTPGPNAGGTRNVTFTASNGVGTNATQDFTLTVNNPAPTITSLSPETVNAGSPSTPITVIGTGFDQQSMVEVDGTPVTTTFSGSSTQLGAVVPAAKLTISGTLEVTVVTPSPGGGTSNSVGLTVVTTVRVSPSAPTLSLNQTRQFAATVSGISDQSVTWFVDDLLGGNSTVGTISSAGLYIAPGTLPSPQTVTVKAVSVGDPTKSGISTVTVSYPASDNYPRPGAGSILRTSPPLIQIPVTGSTMAVLDWTSKDSAPSEEEVLSICNTLSPLGIPHVHVTSVPAVSTYPFLAVAGVFGTLSGSDPNALLNYVSNGGTLFVWGLTDSVLMSNLGAGTVSTITGPTVRPLTFDVPNVDPALAYIDAPEEINWSMTYLGIARTWHYVPAWAQTLATWDDDGKAAILRSDLGSGRAYIFGWRPRHIVSDPQRLIVPGDEPPWTNFPVLDADIQKMLLRGVYENVAGASAQFRQFAPNGKHAALILTHDIDDITSYELTPTFAQFEVGLGVKANYNFTTSPYDTGWVETFYDATGRQEIQEALDLGMDVESHSLGHFPDFDMAPLGTGAETAENYMPRYSSELGETIGFSALGELGVSRWLLEQDFAASGLTVENFRSGYLAVPNDLLQALRLTGYRRDSSYAAGVTRGSFPFVLFGASGGIVTTYPVVEYPVGISDDQHDLPFEPENYDQYVAEWKAVITANHDNNAPTVLLIHPVAGNIDLRQQLEQEIIDWATSTYPDMWVGDWKTFAEFWEAQGVTCARWP